MSANTVQVGQSLTYNTERGPSMSIWKDARISDYREDPGQGFVDGTDWLRVPDHATTSGGTVVGEFDGWNVFLSQGAGITNPTGGYLGGAVALASDGDDEGVVLCSKAGYAIIAPKATGGGLRKLWFEARVKVSTIADTKSDFFFGLLEGTTPSATVPITATGGTLADKNLLGFHRLATDGDQIDVVYKADGQVVQYPTGLTDIITVADSGTLGLVADTYVKLGFKYDRDAPAANRITFFVNGMQLNTFITETMIAAATFPGDMALALCLATLNATGTTPGSVNNEWIWLAGEY